MSSKFIQIRLVFLFLGLVGFSIATTGLSDTTLAQDSESAQELEKSKVVVHEGIVYSTPDDIQLQLNLAEPESRASLRPAILCIHGGGFRAGNRNSYDAMIRKMAQRGYVAATVSYRLAPDHPYPAAVHDVKAAIRWLRANADKYAIDPDRIGVTGQSAGGHLAQYLAVTANQKATEGDGGNGNVSSAVTCCVNFYGTSDLTRSYGRSVDADEVLPLWFGGDLSTHRTQHIQGSPLYWVNPQSAPTLLIHGTEDPYVNIEQAEFVFDRMKAAEAEVEFLKLEGAGHGFKGEQAQQAETAMFDFFAKHLQPGRADDQPVEIARPENATALTQHTWELKPDAQPPTAKIADIQWLEGVYQCEGFGGQIEEVWGPANFGGMVGTFRLYEEGKLNFTEFFLAEEVEGSLRLRLKHFDDQFAGWEKQDEYVEFPLVGIGESHVCFGGLTYQQLPNGDVKVYLAMKKKDGTYREVELNFKRKN